MCQDDPISLVEAGVIRGYCALAYGKASQYFELFRGAPAHLDSPPLG
jgi:hypothetical protein